MFINSKLSKIKRFTLNYKSDKENLRASTDPYAIAEDFLRQETLPVPQLEDYHYELRDRNFEDPLNFLKGKGIINDSQIAVLEDFAKNLSSTDMSIDQAITLLDSSIANQRFSTNDKLLLEAFSVVMKSLKDTNPEIFSFIDSPDVNGRRRMTVGCAVGLVGIGVAFAGLVVFSGGTLAAAVVTSGSYVFACVSMAIGCSRLSDHPL